MRNKRESDVKNYNVGNFYSSPERFKAPFLSITKELLQCLKEDLISELVIISSVRKKGFDSEGKEKKFGETFTNFPQCKLLINEFKRLPVNIDGKEVASHPEGKIIPTRQEVIRDNHPDFDIFIDDDEHKIISALNFFSPDKIYVLPDYKFSRHVQAPNIYHVKTTVSDLKTEDFEKAAQEYKDNHLKNKTQTNEKKNGSSKSF
ncbi:10352_t:CDS:1 [Paraglomus brasilianum]|uniref:10352_t:CDS:1 n=1 Tax=Paraglomus brasilianum TaxID=144538 RepID=A0A9N9DHR3_9GLOM|nr:10352_t:CDS:1 [Paraglomus brasilianum]